MLALQGAVVVAVVVLPGDGEEQVPRADKPGICHDAGHDSIRVDPSVLARAGHPGM